MRQLSFFPLSRRSRHWRLLQLTLLAAPVGSTLYLAVSGKTSPLVCPILSLTGIPCPSCGMTRSWVTLCKGDLPLAFRFHLFGPVVALGILMMMGKLAIELSQGHSIQWNILSRSKLNQCLLILLVGFSIYHIYRLQLWYQTGQLFTS